MSGDRKYETNGDAMPAADKPQEVEEKKPAPEQDKSDAPDKE